MKNQADLSLGEAFTFSLTPIAADGTLERQERLPRWQVNLRSSFGEGERERVIPSGSNR